MKKIIKVFTAICFGLLTAILLSACSEGSTIDTVLTINNDLSGNRNMNVIIQDNVFNEYFQGTKDDLVDIVNANCPEPIEWNFTDNDGVMQLNFTLDFISLDDYKQKVEDILGRETDINISVPDSLWVSGIYVDEDFNSADILGWLKDSLITAGFVSESNAEMVFGTGETQVIYGGESNSTSFTIYLDKIDYIEIDSIDFLTTVKGIDRYDKKIIFNIPTDSMDKKGDEIREYFNNIKPALATLEEEKELDEIVFSLSQEDMSLKDMDIFEKSILGDEQSNIVEENVESKFSPFVFSQYYHESIDLSNYVMGDNSFTTCRYYVSTSNDCHIYYTDSLDYLDEYEYDNDTYPGFAFLDSENYYGKAIEYPILVQKEYNVSEMNVNIKRNPITSKWVRNSIFIFNSTPDENEINIILNRLENSVNNITEDIETKASDEEENLPEKETEGSSELEESENYESANNSNILESDVDEQVSLSEDNSKYSKNVSVKYSSKNDRFSITVTQKGTSEDIAKTSGYLFGCEDGAWYSIEDGFYKVKKQEAILDYVDYTDILGNTDENFVIHYQLEPGILSKKQYSNLDDDKVTFSHGKLSTDIYDKQIIIEYVGSKLDLMSLFMWTLLGGALLLLMISIIKSGIIRVHRKNHEKDTSSINQKPILFCEKCGTPRSPGSLFCEKCGEKFK